MSDFAKAEKLGGLVIWRTIFAKQLPPLIPTTTTGKTIKSFHSFSQWILNLKIGER